jgi:parvulin-like peptidyl-prolyl isomerase
MIFKGIVEFFFYSRIVTSIKGFSMKRTYTIASLLLSTCLLGSPVMATTLEKEQPGPAAVAEKKLVDQTAADIKKAVVKSRKEIVANVEGADISMYDLVRMMNRVASAFYADVQILTPEINKEIQERALERLIFEELAIREAVRQNISIDPERIDKVIGETKKLYPKEEGYQKYLDDIGINEEQLRSQIKRRSLLQAITGKEVYQKVTIDPEDVERLYKDYVELGKLKRADEFFVKEIVLLEGKDKKSVEAAANGLLEQLKEYDYDFGKFTLDGTFIVRKLRVKKDKLPVIFKTMETMEVGEISGVVEDGGTFHIFKVIKNEPGRDMTREEAKGVLEDRLGPYSQEKRKAAWVEELKKDAKITIYENKLEKMVAAKK